MISFSSIPGMAPETKQVFFSLYNCLYLYLAVLDFRCCTGFSLAVGSGGCSLVVLCRLLIAAASLAAKLGL